MNYKSIRYRALILLLFSSRTILCMDQQECIICYENLTTTNPLRTLVCNHTFHEPCITQWYRTGPLTTHNKCPLCKTEYETPRFSTTYAHPRPHSCNDTYVIIGIAGFIGIGMILWIISILRQQNEKASF